MLLQEWVELVVHLLRVVMGYLEMCLSLAILCGLLEEALARQADLELLVLVVVVLVELATVVMLLHFQAVVVALVRLTQ